MSHHPDDEFEVEYCTRDEAFGFAQAEAIRGYQERPKSISYVAHIAEFHDYCLCEFVLEEGGWVKTIRGLAPEERLPGEEIRDETIQSLARSGNMVSAIRLYRSKHQVGLKQAYEAVQSML